MSKQETFSQGETLDRVRGDRREKYESVKRRKSFGVTNCQSFFWRDPRWREKKKSFIEVLASFISTKSLQMKIKIPQLKWFLDYNGWILRN